MTPRGPERAIVRGGLGGLAARLLEPQGLHDIVLFEARDLLGGSSLRIDAQGRVRMRPCRQAIASSVGRAGSGRPAALQ